MSLREKDVPGASLKGRDPSELKIPELKRWLACRAAPLKGKKADLVAKLAVLVPQVSRRRSVVTSTERNSLAISLIFHV